MAPLLLKCIPIAERNLFKLFCIALLGGPALEDQLRYVLALVLLLRHPEVQQAHPNHRLVHALVESASVAGATPEQLTGWVDSVGKHWRASNSTALSIAEV